MVKMLLSVGTFLCFSAWAAAQPPAAGISRQNAELVELVLPPDDLPLFCGSDLSMISISHVEPIISREGYPGIQLLWDRQEVLLSPERDIRHLAHITPLLQEQDGQVYMPGNTTLPLVLIDGVKIRGTAALPQKAIKKVEMRLAGIPADLGDSVSGFVLVSTR